MFKKLKIKNFKSVKDVELDLKRVNLMIGEPNTGKSNIREAFSFFSLLAEHSTRMIKNYIRLTELTDFFYDNLTDEPSLLALDDFSYSISYSPNRNSLDFQHHNTKAQINTNFTFSRNVIVKEFNAVKFYRFKDPQIVNQNGCEFLKPPFGENLFNIVYGSKKLRQLVQNYYKPYGLNLILKPQTKTFEVQKIEDGLGFSYPFELSADTLRRMMFYEIAVESNKNSTLIFEEPESFVFPFYLKLFGEKIAADPNNNQYFIVTHNPYLLQALIEKTPKDEIAVFAAYYRNFETKVKTLSENEIADCFDQDPFMAIAKEHNSESINTF